VPRATRAWQYGDDYRSPSSLAELGDWFIEHVPQGARVVVERSTPFNSYAGFPGRPIYHQYAVESLFDEDLSAYRERGYDYVVWSSKGFHDGPESEANALADLPYFKDAVEVEKWLTPAYRSPNIVLFRLLPLQQHPLYAWFTSAISFRGYDLNAESFKPGTDITLTLYWMSAEVIPNNYIIFVHLIDPKTGTLLVGQDGPPDNGNTPTWKWQGDMQFIGDTRTLSIPADIAPGTYSLRVGMYDADTKARVDILDLQYRPIGNSLIIQNIEIQE
jgi:hypothetical protein